MQTDNKNVETGLCGFEMRHRHDLKFKLGVDLFFPQQIKITTSNSTFKF